MSEGDRYFHQNNSVFAAMRKVTGRLEALKIPVTKLPRDFGKRLDPYVQAKFDELWQHAQVSELPDNL